MKLSTLIAAAVVAAAAASGCGSSGEAAASVAGIDYPVDDLHDHLAALNPGGGVRVARADAAAWLEEWVFFTALELDLAERGAAVTDADQAQTRAEMIQRDPSFDPNRPGGEFLVLRRALVKAARQWAVDEIPDAVGEFDSAMDGEAEAARRTAQAEVDGRRDALILELVAGVESRYRDRVRIDRRYGEWDPETFRIVVGAGG